MQLVTDTGPCNLTLRSACLALAIIYLVSFLVGAVFRHIHTGLFVGYIVEIICNIALLFGAWLNNKWLVLVWLIGAAIFFINWPIAILGVIFNFGPYRAAATFDNIFLILIEYIIILIVFVYVTRIVYSFYQQLRGSYSNTQHSVVV